MHSSLCWNKYWIWSRSMRQHRDIIRHPMKTRTKNHEGPEIQTFILLMLMICINMVISMATNQKNCIPESFTLEACSLWLPFMFLLVLNCKCAYFCNNAIFNWTMSNRMCGSTRARALLDIELFQYQHVFKSKFIILYAFKGFIFPLKMNRQLLYKISKAQASTNVF